MLRRFLELNRRASARFTKRRDIELYRRYDRYVAANLRAVRQGAIVVDLGGGQTCSFAADVGDRTDLRIVAVDISASELAANTQVQDTRVADVAEDLPFDPGSVDLIVSRTLLEHVKDVAAAAKHISDALKPGGATVHLVPCRYALFAVLARTVQFTFAKRVLHGLIPESRGVVEFDVQYDRCHPRALEETFRAAGFADVDVECTWDQADYFKSLFPVFLGVYAYQRLVERLGIRRLASYAIVQATR